MNYSNFEIIYRNSIPPSNTYKFINVIENENNGSACIFTIRGEKFALEVSYETVSMQSVSPKEYCVAKAITESRLFLKNAWYLYKENGVFGRYNIEKQVFEAFDNKDAEQKVHQFYYNTMSK